MLVLSRTEGQDIIIGEGPNAITLTVVSINGDKVRLGLDAPREIPIHRREIHDAIQDGKPDPSA